MFVTSDYLECARNEVAKVDVEYAKKWMKRNEEVIAQCTDSELHQLLRNQMAVLNSLLQAKIDEEGK